MPRRYAAEKIWVMVRQGPGTRFVHEPIRRAFMFIGTKLLLQTQPALQSQARLPWCRLSAETVKDRPHPADDRRSGVDRQADRQCGQTVHAAKGRHRRWQEDRSHPQDDAAVPTIPSASRRLIVNDKVNFSPDSVLLQPRWRRRRGDAS